MCTTVGTSVSTLLDLASMQGVASQTVVSNQTSKADEEEKATLTAQMAEIEGTLSTLAEKQTQIMKRLSSSNPSNKTGLENTTKAILAAVKKVDDSFPPCLWNSLSGSLSLSLSKSTYFITIVSAVRRSLLTMYHFLHKPDGASAQSFKPESIQSNF